MKNGAPMTRSRIFVSYSHSDSGWLRRLQVQLRPMIREGLIDYWDDTMIHPGNDWRTSIEEALSAARVAILLISPEFLASDFIAHSELPHLLRAAEQEGTVILSLILSPSLYTKTTLLSRFQAVNTPDRPLAKLKKWQRDEVFVELANEIQRVFETPQASTEPREEEAPTDPQRDPQTPSAEVLDLFGRLTPIPGGLDQREWNALSGAQRCEFEQYLLQRLRADPVKLETVRVLFHVYGQLSDETRRSAGTRLTEFGNQPDLNVRAAVAWEFRWMSEPLAGGQPIRALFRMLDDSVREVAANAMTSLGFLSWYGRSSNLWPEIDRRSWQFWEADDEELVDAAMFYTAKVLAGGEGRVTARDAFPSFMEQIRGDSTTLRERAFLSVSEFGFRLSEEQLREAVEVTREMYDRLRGPEAHNVVRFWMGLFTPVGSVLGLPAPKLTSEEHKALDQPRRALAEYFLPVALEMLEHDSRDRRVHGLFLLSRMGGFVPRVNHAEILDRIITLWRIDRTMSLRSITEAVNSYVGEIPERLAEQIERHKVRELEGDGDYEH